MSVDDLIFAPIIKQASRDVWEIYHRCDEYGLFIYGHEGGATVCVTDHEVSVEQMPEYNRIVITPDGRLLRNLFGVDQMDEFDEILNYMHGIDECPDVVLDVLVDEICNLSLRRR